MNTGETIKTIEKLTIDASRVNRYLSYPRKVPIWKLTFSLPEECVLFRDEDNSDIAIAAKMHAAGAKGKNKNFTKADKSKFLNSLEILIIN